MRTAERRAKAPLPEAAVNGRVAFRLAGRVDFPAWITDHESFRRWARSPECPEHLRVAFYDGGIWVDPDMERFYAHNQVKLAVALTLGTLVRTERLGRFADEGMLWSNLELGFSTVPDGYFVSFDALRAGRVRRIPGAQGDYIELEGTPELVVEVVSDSSVQKDLIDMPPRYYAAGVLEYWTIDVRGDEPVFRIWKRGPKGFVLPRKAAGQWRRSEVFGRSFRLAVGQDELGDPLYTVEVK
jgi:Uma2 family endonuclease